jgi:hypothetical protein
VGRPIAEIIKFAGKPRKSQTLISGDQYLTWQGKDFWTSATVTVTLVFDRYGVCGGVADETATASGGLSAGLIFPLG